MPFFIAFILPKVNDQPAIETGRFVLNIHCSKTLQIATIITALFKNYNQF